MKINKTFLVILWVWIFALFIFIQRVEGRVLTKKGGINTFEGHQESWYNLKMTKVIQRAQANGITGVYWESPDGLKMYGSYIIVAANYEVYPYGSLVNISRGMGIVLDTGEFIKDDPMLIDLAVTW